MRILKSAFCSAALCEHNGARIGTSQCREPRFELRCFETCICPSASSLQNCMYEITDRSVFLHSLGTRTNLMKRCVCGIASSLLAKRRNCCCWMPLEKSPLGSTEVAINGCGSPRPKQPAPRRWIPRFSSGFTSLVLCVPKTCISALARTRCMCVDLLLTEVARRFVWEEGVCARACIWPQRRR